MHADRWGSSVSEGPPRRSRTETTVLVVEDDPGTRATLAELLEDHGYRAAAAANGQEALEYLRTHSPPAVILLDLVMPVMDGWRFRAEQQRDPTLAAIPVVLLTGAHEAQAHADALHAVSYLEKPFDLGGL